MRQPRKILACVDQSDYATHVADYAAWAATRLSSPLELLHVIDRHQEVASEIDRSGSIGMDAQENLLERLSQEEGERSRAAPPNTMVSNDEWLNEFNALWEQL